jgi:hypothetical protein
MNVSNYSVYLTTGPENHHVKKAYGGDHITMAKCQKFNGKALTAIVDKTARKNLANESCDISWKPKKWEIQSWKGRFTMVITSKRLLEVARQLQREGVNKLMGPGNGKSKFHVTLPKYINSKQEAEKYADELSKKDWSLTVVNKKKSGACWDAYSNLYQN